MVASYTECLNLMLPTGERTRKMASQRPKDKAKLVDPTITAEARSAKVIMASSSLAESDDATGRLALVLASFALAVATFLIVLVAIAASNA